MHMTSLVTSMELQGGLLLGFWCPCLGQFSLPSAWRKALTSVPAWTRVSPCHPQGPGPPETREVASHPNPRVMTGPRGPGRLRALELALPPGFQHRGSEPTEGQPGPGWRWLRA